MDTLILLRATYLGAAASVLLVFAVPPLRSRFLDYGARTSELQQKKKGHTGREDDKDAISTTLDYAATLTVPHSWFTSFYAVSVACSLYWLTELIFHGPAFQVIAKWSPSPSSTMTARQVQVAWVFMFMQGSRRLYESLALGKPSQSRMWFGHWALGILFYVCTSIAVWVEGIPTILTYQLSTKDLVFSGPGFRTFVGTLLFILASGFQHDCHSYLAALKVSRAGEKAASGSQYRLPDHPAWSLSLTPHYLAECLIYIALAVVAAPQGALLNWSFVCALTFVAINLGITAHGTRIWYEQKFGKEAVKGRARMIPFIY